MVRIGLSLLCLGAVAQRKVFRPCANEDGQLANECTVAPRFFPLGQTVASCGSFEEASGMTRCFTFKEKDAILGSNKRREGSQTKVIMCKEKTEGDEKNCLYNNPKVVRLDFFRAAPARVGNTRNDFAKCVDGENKRCRAGFSCEAVNSGDPEICFVKKTVPKERHGITKHRVRCFKSESAPTEPEYRCMPEGNISFLADEFEASVPDPCGYPLSPFPCVDCEINTDQVYPGWLPALNNVDFGFDNGLVYPYWMEHEDAVEKCNGNDDCAGITWSVDGSDLYESGIPSGPTWFWFKTNVDLFPTCTQGWGASWKNVPK